MNKSVNRLRAGRPSKRNDMSTFERLSDDTTELKRVNFQVSAELHAKLKVYAAKKGKSVKELLTDYIAGLPD